MRPELRWASEATTTIRPTGAARTVTVASFLLGTVSGSGVATTVTLGSIASPMLKKAGFRFLMDDEEEGFGFCQKMADVVQRPVQSEIFDFGSDPLVADLRAIFRAEPGVATL